MSFSKGVVLLLSPFNTISDFEKILKAIEELDIETLKESRIDLGKEYNEVLSKFHTHQEFQYYFQEKR